MDDSHRRIQLKKGASASLSQVLISFLLAIFGLIVGTLVGGWLHHYLYVAGEVLGPLFGIAGFAWGISIARKKAKLHGRTS